MYVCVFFPYLHITAPMLIIFGMMVEDLPGEVVDTLKRAWGRVQANIFPHYFLCKKGIGIDNSGTIHLSHHFLHTMHHKKKWT
jgi:hypothetical protein